MNTLETKTNKKGSGLIFAVVLMFVILGMVITLSSITILETKMSQKTKSSIGAFYNSESGVEWALNKISNSTESNILGTFPRMTPTGKVPCPDDFGCELYLLNSEGKVITSNLALDEVKAVRSVGTQDTGEVTQRAIEAAVAATGGGCYVSKIITRTASCPDKSSTSDSCCLSGFKNKGYVGEYGVCVAATGSPGVAYGVWNWEPQNVSVPTTFIPGVGLGGNQCYLHGSAFTCCQN